MKKCIKKYKYALLKFQNLYIKEVLLNNNNMRQSINGKCI
jgi:hypothetical protein